MGTMNIDAAWLSASGISEVLTMKAWIISDIHTNRLDRLWSRPLVPPDADVCICAGDVTSEISDSLDYLLANIVPIMPVVLTLGNHEYYGLTIEQTLARARNKLAGSQVHLLENETVEVGGVKFIGATLWTDFEIATGTGDEHDLPEIRLAKARKEIRHHAIDFYSIKSDRRPGGFIDVDELRDRHIASREFIARELEATAYDQPSVVLTHHAPLTESLDWRFDGNLSNAAYASDLSGLIKAYKPKVWVHGHIHRNRDYVHDHTRVICNPRGLARGSAWAAASTLILSSTCRS
ncbi:metallophosphoesterase [Rhizobium esperanzae]|uniref:metallophosphoesterase n=1 Tax=Rhizobium esperanzae TaxID=1967781 RepID=UPI001FDA6259|nr:metallophosphoesterase [Rhizobium esperanzae]